MKSTIRAGAVGLVYLLFLMLAPKSEPTAVLAQTHTPVTITRLYTGPDGQTHSEETQADFSNGPFKMAPVNAAELHRTAPGGGPASWHNAPRRQYVITLQGHGEIEIADGKKVALVPGAIVLVEDVTGKGHITRVTGSEDQVNLWLPTVDQLAH